jgi:DNA-binding beta-propeller fold protein YncE
LRSNGSDFPSAIGISPDGTRVFVTGGSAGTAIGPITGHFDYATVAYDAATGSELWVRRYNGPQNADDYALALVVSPDGGHVFVTGQTRQQNPTVKYWYKTLAYDAGSGDAVWEADGPSPAMGGVAIVTSPNGSRVFVTGTRENPTTSTYSYLTLAYSAETGATLWSAHHDAPGNCGTAWAQDLGVSPDGSIVYVAGASWSCETHGWEVVAYNSATGGEIWVDGPQSKHPTPNLVGSPTALAVAPGGARIFVTGAAAGDFTTAAYRGSLAPAKRLPH